MTTAALDADELQALMAAIDEGRRTLVSAPPSAQVAEGDASPAAPVDPGAYDWLVHGRLPVLEAIDERLAERLSSTFTLRLGMEVRARPAPSTMVRCGEIARVCSGRPAYGRIQLAGGAALLVVEPETARPLVAAALGQRRGVRELSARGPANESVTALECSALRALMRSFVQSMQQAWAEVVDWRPALEHFETDPRLCQIAMPEDLGLLLEYQLFGELRGKLRLVLPAALIAPHKERLQGLWRPGAGREAATNPGKKHDLVRSTLSWGLGLEKVPDVSPDQSFEAGCSHLPIERIVQLGPGVVVGLVRNAAGTLDIRINDGGRACGEAGAVSDRLCVHITGLMGPAEGGHDAGRAPDLPDRAG